MGYCDVYGLLRLKGDFIGMAQFSPTPAGELPPKVYHGGNVYAPLCYAIIATARNGPRTEVAAWVDVKYLGPND